MWGQKIRYGISYVLGSDVRLSGQKNIGTGLGTYAMLISVRRVEYPVRNSIRTLFCKWFCTVVLSIRAYPLLCGKYQCTVPFDWLTVRLVRLGQYVYLVPCVLQAETLFKHVIPVSIGLSTSCTSTDFGRERRVGRTMG